MKYINHGNKVSRVGFAIVHHGSNPLTSHCTGLNTTPPAQNELYASGDHYLLFVMLSKMGFRPPSDAMEIYQMTGQVLAAGWDE